jgi:hypothetical protein
LVFSFFLFTTAATATATHSEQRYGYTKVLYKESSF